MSSTDQADSVRTPSRRHVR